MADICKRARNHIVFYGQKAQSLSALRTFSLVHEKKMLKHPTYAYGRTTTRRVIQIKPVLYFKFNFDFIFEVSLLAKLWVSQVENFE